MEFFFLPQEHVLFGQGSLSGLADEVSRLESQRVLIITGQTLFTQTNVIANVVQELGSLHVGTFTGIRQHAPKSDVALAVEQARILNADLLVSVGGGSPIDAAKAVSMALSEQRGSFPPHIAIPTTLSAAEFSHLVGVTDETLKIKAGFAHTRLVPRSVILDAHLTLATPMQLWLSSGIRALDHAIETLYAPDRHPINDVLALEAISKLFEYLPRTKSSPGDLEARTELQLAAWMSFFGEVNTSMGLSHNLGRRIGASYDVPHGITSCITLPHVMRVLAPRYTIPLLRVAQELGVIDDALDDVEAATNASDAVSELIRQLGLPQRLRDVGIPEADLHKIATTTRSGDLDIPAIEAVLREMF